MYPLMSRLKWKGLPFLIDCTSLLSFFLGLLSGIFAFFKNLIENSVLDPY